MDPVMSKSLFRNEGLSPPFAGSTARRLPTFPTIASAQETALSRLCLLPGQPTSKIDRSVKGKKEGTVSHFLFEILRKHWLSRYLNNGELCYG